MRLEVHITETEVRQLILDHLREKLGSVELDVSAVRIETKSKQNFRAEWEEASFRVRYEGIGA